ncbi:hypothetical protein ACHHYP_08589 [Achlya hypogyna]|uniref:Uncharacterized protein n=1 Tax=Achlya hypogyna TaxID=1202772 RepID=A0A1V9ZKG4_ACHHY|nr:hypothetical protein ACHHYP_08589 [Achlya hypogyna]
MAHYLKLLLRDVKNSDRCEWDDNRKKFVLGSPPQLFTRVRVMGVVRGLANHMLEIDDGTATILVQATVAVSVGLGDLIDCLGELNPLHPRMKCQYIMSTQYAGIKLQPLTPRRSIYRVENPNMETLRFLEVLQLYKECYFSGRVLPTDPMDGVAPLPTVVKASLKRKFAPEGLPSLPSAALPTPAEYFFTVPEAECDRFASGARQLELRANKPPYAIVRAGDTVVVNGSFVTKVRATRTYSSLAKALAAEDSARLLPAGTSNGTLLAHRLAHAAAVQAYFRSYLSEHEERAAGVVVLEMGNPPVVVLSAEETSSLLYQQLEAAADGMTLEELAIACPQLKTQAILDAVTNMQMDGMIYVANLRYLVL